MSAHRHLQYIRCQEGGVATLLEDTPDIVNGIDRSDGSRYGAAIIREPNVSVPAGVKAEIEVVLEHASDAAFSDVEVLGDYADCPDVCCIVDNSDNDVAFSGPVCAIVPLRCLQVAKRFVRVVLTLKGSGVNFAGTSVVDFLTSGHPVVGPKE